MCVAAEGSSACTPPGALAYWSSAHVLLLFTNRSKALVISLAQPSYPIGVLSQGTQ